MFLAISPFTESMFVVFHIKYYDIIIEEIWASYGLVNIQSIPDVNDFRYHEVIEKIVKTQGGTIAADYGPHFDRLWPFAISAQYLVKRNYSSSLKYQYSVTPTDLANILSIIASLKDNNLTTVPVLNLLRHFIKQPIRDREFTDFISMLSGANGTVPIIFRINGDIILDRRTLLLFFVLMHSQHLESHFDVSGQQRISHHKEEAGREYETYFKDRLEQVGYSCLPPSRNIAGRDYDIVAFSDSDHKILLVETKFKDPSPSSFSANTLIDQELLYETYGLLPQVVGQQERYDLLFKERDLFQKALALTDSIQNYVVRAYLVTKYTPLISCYGDVRVISEKEFFEKELAKNILR